MARTMALCAFTKIAFGLLEPSLAAEQVRQLDQALRTHPRGGAAWASLLQSLPTVRDTDQVARGLVRESYPQWPKHSGKGKPH